MKIFFSTLPATVDKSKHKGIFFYTLILVILPIHPHKGTVLLFTNSMFRYILLVHECRVMLQV
jgi:hypothetical protein